METYYLSSLDSARFDSSRKCEVLRRLHLDNGKDCMLVRISPPVNLQEYGVIEDVDTLVLLSRHSGQDLSTIATFPFFVFITRPLIHDVLDVDTIAKDQLQILAWGELYRTKQDADDHRFEGPHRR
jgi:hypothetical protein